MSALNQQEIPDIPLNTAIVLAGVAAMLIIGRYVFTSRKGDTLAPHQPHP